MTLDQKIQIWNAIGTWIAGIATFLAVAVSLHLAKREGRAHIKASAGIRLIFPGDGTPPEEHFGVTVVSLTNRPLTINSIGWIVGKGKNKRYCIQPVYGEHTQRYPLQLNHHGDVATFLVSFSTVPNWPKQFAQDFIKDLSAGNMKSLRVIVSLSTGETVEIVPEKNLTEMLRNVLTKSEC